MKAIVLCAGLGTRLRPVTLRWPKPALPFLGQPLIRYAFETVRAAGIREVGINTHHLPQVMEQVAAESARQAGLALTVVHEVGEIQGTGGGIRGFKSFLQGDDCVVLNGDILFPLELRPVITAHQISKAAATMVLMPMPAGETYGTVEINESGLVRRIAGRGPGGDRLTSWHFTGVHVLTPQVFDFMSASGPEDINKDVYQRMLSSGLSIRGEVIHQGFWSDMGTPQRYAQAHQQVLFGQVAPHFFGQANPFVGARALPGGFSASVLPNDFKASGPIFVSEKVTIESGVHLGSAVSLGPGCSIGADAKLNRVAVLDDSKIPGSGLYEDCLLFTQNGKLHQVSTRNSELS